MNVHWTNGIVRLYLTDARDLPIPDNSVDCVVTSPPYWGLRDYDTNGQVGLESTPEEYCTVMVEVFREVWRVLKPTGTLWLNLGDSYASDTKGLKSKDLVGIPWRVAFALQADGWYLRSDIIWSKPNPMPESVTDRPTKAHEYVFLLTKSPRYYYDDDAIKEPSTEMRSGNHSRKANHQDNRANFGVSIPYEPDGTGRNKRSVWEITTQSYPEAHFATFPEKLVEPCILAGCPPSGTVLDPFVGSGTTMAVAQRFDRRCVGSDLNSEYLDLAVKRLERIPIPLDIY